MPRFDHLPPGILPFAVSREAAAELVGVSASTFDKLVLDGRLPTPREVNRRLLWDVDELKAAWRAIPRRGQATAEANTWDAVLP